MTNNFVIQKLCLMRSNDFVVASNTAHSKHEHRRSFLHRGSGYPLPPRHCRELPRDHMSYVTASVMINHVGLSALYRIVGHECQFVDLVLRRAYDIALTVKRGFTATDDRWRRCKYHR